jgi:hypothetical protein
MLRLPISDKTHVNCRMESDDENVEIESMPSPNSERLAKFRRVLSAWKQKELNDIIGENQNTLALNAYTKKTADVYYALKDYIDEGSALTINEPELTDVLGDPETLTLDERLQILQSLFRDLIEFRFTYDTELINSFNPEEKLNTNIVPNE